MTQPKFTPGPYMARSAEEGGTYVGWGDSKIEVRGGPDHLILAAVISDCVPEHEANADLFAAAPDMYAALETAEIMVGFLLECAKLNPHFKDSGNANITLTRIAAALAKAGRR